MRGEKLVLITGLSVAYPLPPFNRYSCVGSRYAIVIIAQQSFILYTLYTDTVTLYHSNGHVTGSTIIRDTYNVSHTTEGNE